MSLKHRISNIGTNQARAMGTYHPFGTGATPMVIPASTVRYYPNASYPWGTAVYEDLEPVWSPDGALIAAYDNGPHGSVKPAGRASPAHQ